MRDNISHQGWENGARQREKEMTCFCSGSLALAHYDPSCVTAVPSVLGGPAAGGTRGCGGYLILEVRGLAAKGDLCLAPAGLQGSSRGWRT